VVFVLLLVVGTNASAVSEGGDELPEYINCVNWTIQAQCSTNTNSTALSFPLYLRFTLWSCEDNCKYNCMHNISDTRSPPLLQFEGKWPFYRLWGIQEPASVIFSLGNLYMHYHYLRTILVTNNKNTSKTNRNYTISTNYYMRPFIIGYCLVNMNTWIQSSIFHTRDLPATEKLDYFSAALTILYSVYFAILRIFHVENSFKQLYIGSILLIMYLAHVYFMSFISFNYVYNMIICGIFAVIQGAMWVLWYTVAYLKKNQSVLAYGHWVLYAIGANALTVLLEVFDFPPIGRVLDAHSLWHFSTIFVAPLWYHFIIQDS
ncbi:Per1-like protein, partial [Circinella umbellata]